MSDNASLNRSVTPAIALSDEEVAQICRPLRQPAAQIRYLTRIGIRANRRPDGSVLVLRQDIQRADSRVMAMGIATPRWTK
ncbi:MAG: DUF4224 domain-containing protein [Pseudomonadota bacterium]